MMSDEVVGTTRKARQMAGILRQCLILRMKVLLLEERG